MSAHVAAPAAVRLQLFLAGASTPLAARAIANTRRLCEQHLAGRYELSIVDLRLHPAAAAAADVVAAPTLVKLHPPPVRRFIGDLSRTETIVAVLAS